MITLALEFSSPVRSVAVLASESQTREAALLGAASDEGARTATPLELVDRALAQASVERESVERVVVGLGPGSYTGIRSAIALAQGWQLARPVRLIGLSTVECLAAQAHAKGWFGSVNVLIDAQRNEFYLAAYEINSSSWQETTLLRLATMEEMQSMMTTSTPPMLIGPEVTRWFPDGRIVILDASALGRLEPGRTDSVSGEELEPIYLRQTAFVKAPPPRILPAL